jgi:hypothetical protein
MNLIKPGLLYQWIYLGSLGQCSKKTTFLCRVLAFNFIVSRYIHAFHKLETRCVPWAQIAILVWPQKGTRKVGSKHFSCETPINPLTWNAAIATLGA